MVGERWDGPEFGTVLPSKKRASTRTIGTQLVEGERRSTVKAWKTCQTCEQRYFDGSGDDRCGVCNPRMPEVDWSTIASKYTRKSIREATAEFERTRQERQRLEREGRKALAGMKSPDTFIAVKLTDEQDALRKRVGMERQAKNRRDGRRDRHGLDAQGDEEKLNAVHVIGAGGELGFSIWSGIPWDASTTYDPDAADVGPYNVRSTRHGSGHLLLHPEDLKNPKGNGIYVLAIVQNQNVFLFGWWDITEGVPDRYWSNKLDPKRPCYAIPQSALRPMSSMRIDRDV